MEVSEPPRIVVESHASCASAERAEELLHDALGAARAPGHAWTVTMRVQPAADHALRAQGAITDELGMLVADRVLSVPAGDCHGLARAVGVWASLVLEQELARRRTFAPTATPASPTVAAAPAAKAAPAPAPTSPVATVADSQSTDSLWPAPAPVEKPPPEGEWYLHHDDARTLEIGVAGFLMSGAGAGAMAGASPYIIVEAGRGVFLRPSFAVGQSLTALNSPPVLNALWVTGRFDTCLRLPGLYTQNRGIQLDLCGGADSDSSPIRPTTSPFPSCRSGRASTCGASSGARCRPRFAPSPA